MIKKLLFLLSSTIFLFSYLALPLTSSQKASAEKKYNCNQQGITFTIAPNDPITSADTNITVTVNHQNLVPDTYQLRVKIGGSGGFATYEDRITSEGEQIIFSNITIDPDAGNLMQLELYRKGHGNRICYVTDRVVTPESSENPNSPCRIVFTSDLTPNDGIFFRAENLSGEDFDTRGIVLRSANNNGEPIQDLHNGCVTNAQLKDQNGIGFPNTNDNRWPEGHYTVTVTNNCSIWNTSDGPPICKTPLHIQVRAGGGRVIGSVSDQTTMNLLGSPCGSDEATSSCPKIKTAFGNVNTDAPGFVRWVIGFILGLSGGILLLIIILSGYRLMTSQGDPEKVKEARERLTAGVLGLLFIIFSFVIYQFVTADVLRLPGFGA